MSDGDEFFLENVRSIQSFIINKYNVLENVRSMTPIININTPIQHRPCYQTHRILNYYSQTTVCDVLSMKR